MQTNGDFVILVSLQDKNGPRISGYIPRLMRNWATWDIFGTWEIRLQPDWEKLGTNFSKKGDFNFSDLQQNLGFRATWFFLSA